MKTNAILLVVCLLMIAQALSAQEILLQASYDSWTTLTIDNSDLISATIGKNLNTTYSSAVNQLLLTIFNSDVNTVYTVTVSISTALPDNMKISVLRTGIGANYPTPQGTITGGDTVAIEATTAGQAFFTGKRNRTDIPVQVIISGVTLDADPTTYLRNITFSIAY